MKGWRQSPEPGVARPETAAKPKWAKGAAGAEAADNP